MSFLELAKERYSVRSYADRPVEQEKNADPDELYVRASLKQGAPLDKCVLYAFRCAVAFAKDPAPNPDNYRWWYYCDENSKSKKGK